jgi:hypothetical protein
MKLFLNSAEVNIEDKGLVTLTDLIAYLKSKVIDSTHKITKIVVDEREVAVDDQHLRLSECLSISITSADPYKLADEGLCNMTEYVIHLLPMIRKCAENFRTKSEEEANKFYGEALSALKLVFDLIGGVENMLSINYSEISVNGEKLNDKILKLHKVLTSMHDAQKNSDWVLLADLLEYELIENLEEWQNSLPAIREEIRKVGTKT